VAFAENPRSVILASKKSLLQKPVLLPDVHIRRYKNPSGQSTRQTLPDLRLRVTGASGIIA